MYRFVCCTGVHQRFRSNAISFLVKLRKLIVNLPEIFFENTLRSVRGFNFCNQMFFTAASFLPSFFRSLIMAYQLNSNILAMLKYLVRIFRCVFHTFPSTISTDWGYLGYSKFNKAPARCANCMFTGITCIYQKNRYILCLGGKFPLQMAENLRRRFSPITPSFLAHIVHRSAFREAPC